MSDSLPNISIGEFAESLLNSNAIPPLHESQAPSMPNVPGSKNQLDISNVEVPDDFMNGVFGGKETNSYLDSILEDRRPGRIEEVSNNEEPINQTEKLSELLENLYSVLSETKQLLSEMAVGMGTTTVGTIGTGYSDPSDRKVSKKKKKKRRRRTVEETVASVLDEIRTRGL